jgi:hypothetical protein
MITAATQRTIPADLPTIVEQRILKRTWGRIDHLSVKRIGEEIVVQCSAPSYYVKQLVVHAVLETFKGRPAMPVLLDIQVCREPVAAG